MVQVERDEDNDWQVYCHSDTEAHDVFVFLFLSLLLGTAIKHLTMLPMFRNVQDTVFIFLLGMTYSLAQEYLELYKWTGPIGHSHCIWMGINPHVLLFALLPVLLTGDAMAIDTAVARQVARQCVFLAGPGLLFCSFVTAGFLYGYLPYGWSFELCLTVGSILAATDPVAVVCLLKDLGAPANLTVLIQGESLLNDGTAIVLYRVTYDLLSGGVWSADDVAFFLIKVVVGAAVLGSVIGCISVVWLKWACKRLEHESSLVQISITLLCAYWSYIAAEGFIGVSGVLATVCSALVLADNMWPLVVERDVINQAWHIFEYFGNTVIFFLAGALSGHAMFNIDAMDYLHLAVIYIVCMVCRCMMLLCSAPMLRFVHPDREPVQLRDLAVMCWGGLRGAVGLSLAIEVSIDRADNNISTIDGHRILFYTGGCAALTLMINATTCPALVKWLGITGTNQTKQSVMLTVHRQLEHTVNAHSEDSSTRLGESELLNELGNSVHLLIDDMIDDVEKHIRSGCKESDKKSIFSSWAVGDQVKRHAERREFNASLSVCSNVPLRGLDVVLRHGTAKNAYESIPEETLGLLRLCRPQEYEKMEDMEQLATDDMPTSSRVRVVNEAFLCMLRRQYWALIQNGEFVSDGWAVQLLLNSVGFGLERASYQLADLRLIARRLQQREEDEPAAAVGRLGTSLLGSKPGLERHTLAAFQSDALQPQGGKSGDLETRSGRVRTCSLVMAVVVVLNVVWICLEFLFQSEFINTMGPLPVIGVDAAFEVVFVFEFVFRFGQLGCEYFRPAVHKWDSLLLAICILGTSLEFGMHMAENGEDAAWFRMVRLVRILRAIWALNVAWRCAVRIKAGRGDMNAIRVHYLTALVCFVQAHVICQQKLLAHFGSNGQVLSCEEARCIIESQTEIYVASVMAADIAKLVDEEALKALFILKESNLIANELSNVVFEAHEVGILDLRETEALLDPMKEHVHSIDRQLRTTLKGKVKKVTSSRGSIDVERHSSFRRSSCITGQPERSSAASIDFGDVNILTAMKRPSDAKEDAPTLPASAARSAWDAEVQNGSTTHGSAFDLKDLRAKLSQHEGLEDLPKKLSKHEDQEEPRVAPGNPKLPTPPSSLASSPRSLD